MSGRGVCLAANSLAWFAITESVKRVCSLTPV
jgi:hypothetical protein